MGSAAWFDWFAEREAAGSSPSYEVLARRAVTDGELCDRLDELPPGLQQPNLLFSAVRLLGGPTDSWREFRDFVDQRWADVEDVLRHRTVQTNEAARCGALVAALGRPERPLALIEVGASAGLCLLLDRFQYVYRSEATGDRTVVGAASPVVIDVRCVGPVPVPHSLPEVEWRAGLDLRPLDVTDDDDVAWLRACVWPEHEARRERLDAAVAVARADPPRVVRGDLATDLADLLAEVPPGTTPVVFHSAVLVYCSPEQRRAFTDVVTSRPDVVWIANEMPGVVAETETAPPIPSVAANASAFVLTVDGRRPLARTDGHGGWIAWA